jgi:hypothetical protein
MMLRYQIKKFLTGLTIPQEYVCLNSKELQHPLSVFLLVDNKKIDISPSHLFLGYRPLILAMPFKISDSVYQILTNQNQITLNFENDSSGKPKVLAQLALKKIETKILGDNVVLFYEGTHGDHKFLSIFHQKINELREKFRKATPTNVSLPGNLIDQVRIAYSVPRSISIITVSDGNKMNMFPTDLHGPVGEKFYIGSLRVGGLANDQVERFGQIVISEVDSSFYKHAYLLGKNHMKELKAETEFQFHSLRSKIFNFPLPVAAIAYRELKKIDFFDVGIHRIHLYETAYRRVVQTDKSSLAHIHQFYAQWRLNHRLPTSILLR